MEFKRIFMILSAFCYTLSLTQFCRKIGIVHNQPLFGVTKNCPKFNLMLQVSGPNLSQLLTKGYLQILGLNIAVKI